jgi:hypothetical protein
MIPFEIDSRSEKRFGGKIIESHVTLVSICKKFIDSGFES